ncbi:collagen-like protein, partial [Cyanobacterium stanieri LEGE 03274]|nr:collagen-like protein [Cyanobacterium stanieri LEGE 03274]
MGWLTKTSLTVAFLFLPEMISPLVENNLCGLRAIANQASNFGNRGNNGVRGADGNDGRSSESITIFADGSPLNLNLAGQNGSTGESGSNGTRALCENQPINLPENLQGAHGGDGGDGGNGGNGGNGGDLTIYATNKDYLKEISVNASAGQGGDGGD